jgi:hypothetical protein
MFRSSITLAGVAIALAAAGCKAGPSNEPDPLASPTYAIDNTRTEGPPLTYEEIERGLVGRWVADADNTDMQASTEWRFYPDRTWETPTLRGYKGRYELLGTDAIRMLEDGGVNALFRFHLIGDHLTMYYVNEQNSAVSAPMGYRRLSRTPAIPTALHTVAPSGTAGTDEAPPSGMATGEAPSSGAATGGTIAAETATPTSDS